MAAAFAIDARVGWVTALAVGLHEVPHRLGDFALLIHMGIARGRAAIAGDRCGRDRACWDGVWWRRWVIMDHTMWRGCCR